MDVLDLIMTRCHAVSSCVGLYYSDRLVKDCISMFCRITCLAYIPYFPVEFFRDNELGLSDVQQL